MTVEAALRYAQASGRWLDRDSEPMRVRAAWERVQRAMQLQQQHAVLETHLAARGIGHASPLVAPLFDARLAWTSDLELTPIVTVGRLFEEAREMQHCVADHVGKALTGKALVFHGTVHGERVTVELARGGAKGTEGWTLAELRCSRNRTPGPAAVTAIRAWADRVLIWQRASEEAVARARDARRQTPGDEIPF
jgi:hypothetical protein